jgi:sulfur carrier protein ThiS
MCGYLHRDPSLGNVLLGPGENKEGFKIPDVFLDHVSSLPDSTAAEEIKEQCGKVEELVAKLGVSTKSFAVITDGDLSISWEKYWDVDRRGFKLVSKFLIA